MPIKIGADDLWLVQPAELGAPVPSRVEHVLALCAIAHDASLYPEAKPPLVEQVLAWVANYRVPRRPKVVQEERAERERLKQIERERTAMWTEPMEPVPLVPAEPVRRLTVPEPKEPTLIPNSSTRTRRTTSGPGSATNGFQSVETFRELAQLMSLARLTQEQAQASLQAYYRLRAQQPHGSSLEAV